MVGAAVPEAAVDENGDPCTRKDDVGPNGSDTTCDWDGIVDSIAEPQGEESGAESHLRLGIPPAIGLHRCAYRRTGWAGRVRHWLATHVLPKPNAEPEPALTKFALKFSLQPCDLVFIPKNSYVAALTRAIQSWLLVALTPAMGTAGFEPATSRV